MGALAPSSLWIPEDDNILRNAVEAGGSLEALAKGAVRFSRRFNVQELQERWFALLYDKDTSEEASSRMLQIELLSSNDPKSSSKACVSKGEDGKPGKRKGESLRRQYNVLRKRICSHFAGIDFALPTPVDYGFTSNDFYCENQKPHGQLFGENCLPDDYCIPEEGFDIGEDVYPDMLMDHMNILDDGLGDGILGEDPLYGQADDVDLMLMDHVGGGMDSCYENGVIERNLTAFQDSSALQEPQPLELSLCGVDDAGTRPFSDSSQVHVSNGDANSTFQGDWNVRADALNCSGSFHPEGYSSPHPELPIWEGTEGTTVPPLTIVESFDNGDHSANVQLMLPVEDVNVANVQFDANAAVIGDDFMPLELDLTENNGTYFSDDENFLMDDNCFESLKMIMNSSADMQGEDMNIWDDCNTVELNDYQVTTDDACIGEFRNSGSSILSEDNYANNESNSAQDVSYVSLKVLHAPDSHEGFIFCPLNTEDPDVPCNDDVFLPAKVNPRLTSAVTESHFEDTALESSSKVGFDGGKSDMSKEGWDMPAHTVIKKLEPNTHLSIIAPKCDPSLEHCHFDKSTDSFYEETVDDQAKSSCINLPSYRKKESEASDRTQACLAFTERGFSAVVECTSLSDQEEETYSDVENEAPYFSDVEAMICDMDLDSDNEASSIYTREAARYQYLDTKKTIVRLERGSHSFVQRSIASHGAFAVFYGRRLKYYIRKPKVYLGRPTENNVVDIDLGREGHPYRISRRQAIILVDKNGSFSIINMSHLPIAINGKEIQKGRSCQLSSGYLIEIRNMAFMFEVNRDCVMQYLATDLSGVCQV